MEAQPRKASGMWGCCLPLKPSREIKPSTAVSALPAQQNKMGQFDSSDSEYTSAIEALSTLLKKSPSLKATAVQKIEELTSELSQNAGTCKDDLVDPLQKLKLGFSKFKSFYKKEEEMFKSLAESQHPKFMIIACSDSRVDPAVILNLGLGEAFIVRNVANIVPPYWESSGSSTASALEYAVLHLKVEHLMVIGHSRCGGIKALMSSKEDGSNKFSEYIEDWVNHGRGAAKKVLKAASDIPFAEQCTHCEKEAVNHSLSNCLTFPFLKDAVEHGKLKVHGAHYDFVNGIFDRWTVDYKISDSVKYE